MGLHADTQLPSLGSALLRRRQRGLLATRCRSPWFACTPRFIHLSPNVPQNESATTHEVPGRDGDKLRFWHRRTPRPASCCRTAVKVFAWRPPLIRSVNSELRFAKAGYRRLIGLSNIYEVGHPSPTCIFQNTDPNAGMLEGAIAIRQKRCPEKRKKTEKAPPAAVTRNDELPSSDFTCVNISEALHRGVREPIAGAIQQHSLCPDQDLSPT